MNHNISYTFSDTFYNTNMEEYIESYINIRKKNNNPIVQKIEKIKENNYQITYIKKLPFFLQNFFFVKEIEYIENICKKNNVIEINTIQSFKGFDFKYCSFLKYGNENIIMTSIININKIPYVIETILKKYIENNYKEDRDKEKKMIEKNKNLKI